MMQKPDVHYLGMVLNPEHWNTAVSISGASLVLGSVAIGMYVGLVIGGDTGEAIGGLVSAYAAGLAYGEVKSLVVELDQFGQVKVKCLKHQRRALLVA